MLLALIIVYHIIIVSVQIPEEGEEREEPSSSYTGMAAALAEALKQRRLHVADKSMSHSVTVVFLNYCNSHTYSSCRKMSLDIAKINNAFNGFIDAGFVVL